MRERASSNLRHQPERYCEFPDHLTERLRGSEELNNLLHQLLSPSEPKHAKELFALTALCLKALITEYKHLSHIKKRYQGAAVPVKSASPDLRATKAKIAATSTVAH